MWYTAPAQHKQAIAATTTATLLLPLLLLLLLLPFIAGPKLYLQHRQCFPQEQDRQGEQGLGVMGVVGIKSFIVTCDMSQQDIKSM